MFLLSLLPTFFSLWTVVLQASSSNNYGEIAMVNHHLQDGVCYSCRGYLLSLATALETYCDEHNGGRLPCADGPDDYYYWTKGITHEYLSKIDLYCPADRTRLAPSSYISDPRLAGKKLSDLKKIPHLVILREREYRHPGERAAFYCSDFCRMCSKNELPQDLKYYPNLPEREKVVYQWIWTYSYDLEWRIIFLCFLGLAITFYILWGLSRRPRERGR